MARKKVLLSFVGNTDPWSTAWTRGKEETPYYGVNEEDINIEAELRRRGTETEEESQKNEGAILGLCDKLRPAILYLLPSKDNETNKARKRNTKWRADWIKNILKKRYPKMECRILPLDVQDATNFEELSKKFEDNIRQICEELQYPEKQYNFHINCTSGTQQMTAIGYVFANRQGFSDIKILQCKDPQFTPRIVKVNTSFLTESICKDKIKSAIKRMDFVSVIDSCGEVPKDADIEKLRKFIFLKTVFNAYTYMDNANYECAYALMNGVRSDHYFEPVWNSLKAPYKEQITAQLKDWEEFRKLEGTYTEIPQSIADQYLNMCRKETRWDYKNEIIQFRSLMESILSYRLDGTYRIRSGDLQHSGDIDNRNKLLDPHQDKIRVEERENRKYIGLGTMQYILFSRYRNTLRKHDDFKVTAKLRRLFNDGPAGILISLANTVIHNPTEPVSKNQVKSCQKCAEDVMSILVPTALDEIKRSNFSDENIKKWGDFL